MATKMSLLTSFRLWSRVSKRCVMFAWTVISAVAYAVRIHQSVIKANTLLVLTCFFLEHAWLLGNNRKMHNGLILSLKLYFEKEE